MVDAHTLADAAAELNVTQQAISSAIRSLENDLGVELFDRIGRRLEITAAGRELYPRATLLLAGGHQAVVATRRAAQIHARPYSIGLTNHDVYKLLEPVRNDITTPITVVQTLPGRTRADLFSGALDLVFRPGIPAEADIATTVIGYIPMRLAVHEDHPLADREAVSLQDLAEHPAVISSDRAAFAYIRAACNQARFDPQPVTDTVSGTPEITGVLTHPEACAFVADPEGKACDGRVRVIGFKDPFMMPVHAFWVPHTSSSVRDHLLAATAANPS